MCFFLDIHKMLILFTHQKLMSIGKNIDLGKVLDFSNVTRKKSLKDCFLVEKRGI